MYLTTYHTEAHPRFVAELENNSSIKFDNSIAYQFNFFEY